MPKERILHVDMDAFYASVEERERPALAAGPLIVGGSPDGRGVVAAANYAARAFGVHSAMPAATAKRLCPQAVFLRPRLSYYAEVSREILAIFHRFTPLVEPLSLDEAFLDVAGSERLFGTAADMARKIKQIIRRELKLVASVGVAPNKFLAKLASDLEKPDGLVVVPADGVQAFLDPLSVSRLWGVGRVCRRQLGEMGIATVGQLRAVPVDVLKGQFGKSGEHLWQLAHGVDSRAVVPDHEAKSISHETTFEIDIEDSRALRTWLLGLAEQVGRRLRRHGLTGRTVQVKVRFSDFRTLSRSQTLPSPTNITREIQRAGLLLLSRALAGERRAVRLIGIGMTGIDSPGPEQGELFDAGRRARQRRLDTAVDAISARFGPGALHRGTGPR